MEFSYWRKLTEREKEILKENINIQRWYLATLPLLSYTVTDRPWWRRRRIKMLAHFMLFQGQIFLISISFIWSNWHIESHQRKTLISLSVGCLQQPWLEWMNKRVMLIMPNSFVYKPYITHICMLWLRMFGFASL